VNRALPFVFLFALSPSAFGQTVDSQGAKHLSQDLSRYVGKQALDKGILKVSVEGDAYKITFDVKALAATLPKQDLPKFDFPPYTLLVKPRGDGGWDFTWPTPVPPISVLLPASILTPSPLPSAAVPSLSVPM